MLENIDISKAVNYAAASFALRNAKRELVEYRKKIKAVDLEKWHQAAEVLKMIDKLK